MKIKKVRKIAENLGVKTNEIEKTVLIRAIQSQEGNSPCFQSGMVSCDQYDCCWRDDCLPEDSTGRTHLSKKEKYLNKLKFDIEEFKNNIDELKTKASEMVGKSKTEVLDELKRLEKKSEEEIKHKIHEVAEAGEDVWKKTKKGIDHSWDDLSKTFKKISGKVGKDKNPPPS